MLEFALKEHQPKTALELRDAMIAVYQSANKTEQGNIIEMLEGDLKQSIIRQFTVEELILKFNSMYQKNPFEQVQPDGQNSQRAIGDDYEYQLLDGTR